MSTIEIECTSNTTVKNLRMTHNASTVGCSQLIPSIQTPKFTTILDQRVQDQMTYINNKYEELC